MEERPTAWPLLSIVTPSYMQGAFLEETIRSVLLQGYPRLEYFILDGGSTDSSLEIIQKYAPWLAGWRSERDRGQSDAVNEGWKKATGEVVAWINSDDYYHPCAFFSAMRPFAENRSVQWVAGDVEDRLSDGAFVKRHQARAVSLCECLGRQAFGYHQPGMFWQRSLIERIGPLDSSLRYGFDYDLWVRCHLEGIPPFIVNAPIANFRRHRTSKSVSEGERFLLEDWRVFQRHVGKLPTPEQRKARAFLRAYEADVLPDIVYRRLRSEGRGSALRHLLSRREVLPYVKPRKLVAGMFGRILISGRAPDWIGEKSY